MPLYRIDAVPMEIHRRPRRQRVGNERNWRIILLRGPYDGADGSASCDSPGLTYDIRQSRRAV